MMANDSTEVTIQLSANLFNKVRAYAGENNCTVNDAASQLVSSLVDKGTMVTMPIEKSTSIPKKHLHLPE